MLAKVLSPAVLGIDGVLVDAGGNTAPGFASFAGVSLPNVALKESRDRVEAAIKNTRFESPARHITVHLAPADNTQDGKDGAAFRLPRGGFRPRTCWRSAAEGSRPRGAAPTHAHRANGSRGEPPSRFAPLTGGFLGGIAPLAMVSSVRGAAEAP